MPQTETSPVNETLLELVAKVSAMGARLETMGDSLKTVQSEVSDLKNMANQAQGFSNAAKAMWTLIGLMLGAGGTEMVQKFLAVAP